MAYPIWWKIEWDLNLVYIFYSPWICRLLDAKCVVAVDDDDDFFFFSYVLFFLWPRETQLKCKSYINFI